MGLFDGIDFDMSGLSLPSMDTPSLGGADLGTGTPNLDPGNIGSNPFDPQGLSRLENGVVAAPGGPANANGINIQTLSIPQGNTLAGNPNLTPVGTLNVGDRYASLNQNSPMTVAARGPELRGEDSLAVNVEGTNPPPAAESASPDTTSAPTEDNASQSSFSFSSGGGNSSIGEDEEKERRAQQTQISRACHASAAQSAPTLRSTHSPQVVQFSHTPSAHGGSSRYVLEAHDVHEMGGTSSRIQISDRNSGQVLRNVHLPAGDSRTIVDLPPGQYNFTAIAGERPAGNANPDHLDNFRVEVFQASPPTSSSGGGGGSVSPG